MGGRQHRTTPAGQILGGRNPCGVAACDNSLLRCIHRWHCIASRHVKRISRAALSIWWALRTSPCRGPNPSVDRLVRWMRRAPGWQGAPDGQQAKN